ncbi:MAG: hypothetical protein KAG28_05870 [Cocleimonas sp.]|nr:hypothetical protein [Cocleimonas sp.]
MASFHQANQTYNILYRTGCCYLIKRQLQGEEATPDWLQNMAWREIFGVYTFDDQHLLMKLEATDIVSFLKSVKV